MTTMREALLKARSFVELCYDEEGGEEAADAKHVLGEIDAALSQPPIDDARRIREIALELYTLTTGPAVERAKAKAIDDAALRQSLLKSLRGYLDSADYRMNVITMPLDIFRGAYDALVRDEVTK